MLKAGSTDCGVKKKQVLTCLDFLYGGEERGRTADLYDVNVAL